VKQLNYEEFMIQKKIALVTGANKGIGAEIAIQLSEIGYDIWLNYLSDDIAAENIKRKINSNKQNCTLIKCDVANEEAVKNNFEKLLNNDIPYVIINNAGVTSNNLFINMTSKEWKEVINVTLNGFFNITKIVLPKMIQLNNGGRIINITSMAAHGASKGFAHYSAAKAGLLAATKVLANELAEYKILVNAVSPGIVDTDRLRLANLPLEEMAKAVPLKRLATPKDIANIVSFLVSEKGDYITGQEFNINGGVYIS
jgi:3-oxoacyl-[acyl-carrier protein] reductase